MITLYDFVLSANCYKVRLFCGLLDVDYETVAIDFHPGREHKGEAFRTINPLGHIPVLDDDGYLIRDAHAILIYLAVAYDPQRTWYPMNDAKRLGQVAQWMAFADGTANTASAARLHVNLGYDFDVGKVRAGAHELFAVLDEHLWFRERDDGAGGWLAEGHSPTIADVALFPDVALAEEGGVSLLDYPAVVRWADRVRQIPGFVVMPGVFHFGRS
ncbi:MAG: glutathione S-transferase family protein [Actinomycetota bacterium]